MEIIEQIENRQLSQNQASKRYGVHRKTISGWLEKYGNVEIKLKEMGGKSPAQEIAELRAKLRVLENEKEVWRFIFNVIEEEYREDAVKDMLKPHSHITGSINIRTWYRIL
jgi:transposase